LLLKKSWFKPVSTIYMPVRPFTNFLHKLRSLTALSDKQREPQIISPEPFTEDALLDALTSAINCGHWNYWASAFPDVFQLEFKHTLLNFPPAQPDAPPDSLLAIQLVDPISVHFLSAQPLIEHQNGWPYTFQSGKMGSLPLEFQQVTFTQSSLKRKLLQQASGILTIYGDAYDEDAFLSAPYSLVFMTTQYGCAVSGKSIRLLSRQGDVSLSDIPDLKSKWWAYYHTYWEKRKTDQPLPKDWRCETIIPARR